MAAPSTPRAITDDEPEVYRLSDDPADADENAAATKVGPMSKAFVDQLMFKAHIAESSPPGAKNSSTPPASATRPRTSRSAGPTPEGAGGEIARLSDEDEGLHQEVTVLSDLAMPPEACPSPEASPPSPAARAVTPNAGITAALETAVSAPPPPPHVAIAPPAPQAVEDGDAPAVPSVSPPPASVPFQSFHSVPPVLYVEPTLSPRAARWMASSSVYPMQHEAPRDLRPVIQAAVVIGALVLGTIATIVWLFP